MKVYEFRDGTRRLARYRVYGPSTNWEYEYVETWERAQELMRCELDDYESGSSLRVAICSIVSEQTVRQ